MSFRVELTAEAYADLERLMAWLEERSSLEAANQFSERFFEALSRLESEPLSCGLAYENRYAQREIRHLLFEPTKSRTYRALFVIQGEAVKILCIRAPGEKPVKRKDLQA